MRIYYTDNYRGGREESRRLLEKAFAVHTGDKEQAETLIRALKKGEHGKPYIDGFSCFSISHTGSIWAVLIADAESTGIPESGECGLDIQLGKDCDFRAIADRWFAPEDAALIKSRSSNIKDSFFRIWTRREALAKALGGTVYDSELPAVSRNHLTIDGKYYTVSDISFPEMSDLYASICIYPKVTTLELDFLCLQKEFF